MKSFSLFALCCSALLISACQTGQVVNQKPEPQKMSMLDISRELSDGRVDVYDPGLPILTMPETPQTPVFSNAPVPKSSSVIVNDPSVTIYSLDEITPATGTPQPLDVVPLPPLGGPDLQPPAVSQPDYPSPFPVPRKKSDR